MILLPASIVEKINFRKKETRPSPLSFSNILSFSRIISNPESGRVYNRTFSLLLISPIILLSYYSII